MRRGWEDFAVVSDADVLLRAVRAGKVEVVLASNLRGLGRSVSHLVELLREFVTRKGHPDYSRPGHRYFQGRQSVSRYARRYQ